VSQRVGGVRLQTICLFLAAPGYFVLPVWHSWPALAVSLFVLSVINEAVRPANAVAITSVTTPEVRTRALSLNRLATNLGFSFGPMIGGVLATIDFRLLFLVDGLTTLAAAALLLWVFRMREAARVTVEPPMGHLQLSPAKDRVFVAMMALMLVDLVVFVQFGATYPLYLVDHFGLSKRTIGLMFAVNTMTIVLVEMVLLDAIKNWRPLRTIGWGCLLSCVGFGILPFGSSVLYAVGAMLVVTVGEMLSFPITAGFTANRSTRGNEGTYMGWYALMFATASVLGPAIGSAIYQWRQEAVWYWALAVGVVVFVGFQVLAGRVEGRESTTQRTLPIIDAVPMAEVIEPFAPPAQT
jgi:MFS family permease